MGVVTYIGAYYLFGAYYLSTYSYKRMRLLTRFYGILLYTLGRTNTYVNIIFQPTNKIVCTFLDQREGQGTISCDIAYGPCQQQPNMIARGKITSPNTVDTDLSINSEYCYVVTASNGTFAILIDLIFSSEW